MPKRFYFFITASPETKPAKEKLCLVGARTDMEARKGLFKRMTGRDFSFKHLGWVSEEDMRETLLPPSGISQPLQAISAVKYVAEEYAPLFSKEDKAALKRIEKKMVKDFFG